MMAEPVPLSTLELDLPAPASGWAAELRSRGVAIAPDDLGRPSISRDAARELFAERREQEAAAARHRAEVEQRAIEADRRFRAGLPGGVPVGAVPEGLDAGLWMLLSDPARPERRESLVEHALENSGSAVFHSIAPSGGPS
jgi:hypothetical protein